MDPDALLAFVQRGMRMSHVYQPVVIRELAEAGGKATIRQLALALLVRDESQIEYYVNRIRTMPLPVLRKHGIVRTSGDLVELCAGSLTFEQRARLHAACDARIGEFLTARGMSTWDYRMMVSDPVPTDLRYTVLRNAKGRCHLCGVSAKERRIEVDHIVPRSRGGTNDLSNLQALCDECNQGKSNRDATDFR
jgi:ATP adenylyltransferase